MSVLKKPGKPGKAQNKRGKGKKQPLPEQPPIVEPPSWKSFPVEWQVFLRQYAKTGNISVAANSACVDRCTPYEWKKKHPEFASAWHDAEQARCDAAEACFAMYAGFKWQAAEAFLNRYRPTGDTGGRPKVRVLLLESEGLPARLLAESTEETA